MPDVTDKRISELPPADTIGTADLFVTQQNNQAKKVTGQVLIERLAEELDGHGGITSFELTETEGTAKTYTITYADGSTQDIVIHDGERGYTGAQTYVHIRYAAEYPVQTILTTPNKFIGIYTGTMSAAPAAASDYIWYEWKGAQGPAGKGITGIAKTSTSGDTDTYTVTFSDGTTTTFSVKNGSNIASITKTGVTGLVDTYTVTLTDGSTTTFTVTNAKSIASVALVSGTHAAGTFDTYRITFNDGDTFDYSVYNGANGTGAVTTVAGIPVVGENGNVPLITIQNTAPTSATVGFVNQLLFDTTGGVMYICTDDTGGTYTWRGTSVTVDSALSSSSENPVQNKVVYTALDGKVPTGRKINNKPLSTDITLDCSDIGAVPISRTINGNALSANIVTRLIFASVSVATSSWVSDSTYDDYDYKAVISLNDVTAAMIPDVVFDPDDATGGNFAPVALAGAGSVTIYAKEIPSAAITIPSIICFA